MLALPDIDKLVIDPPELGCGLYLPGLPGGSNKIHDRSPYGNTGTITGATWKRLPSGLWYLYFDGSDDRIDTASTLIPASADFSILCWVKTPDYTVHSCIVGQYSTGTSGRFMFFVFQTSGKLCIGITGVNDIISSNAVGTDWVYVAMTRIGDDYQLYINGQTDGNGSDSTDLDVSVNTIVGAARSPNPVLVFNGNIGEVRIYNRALTPLEIENHRLLTKCRYQ